MPRRVDKDSSYILGDTRRSPAFVPLILEFLPKYRQTGLHQSDLVLRELERPAVYCRLSPMQCTSDHVAIAAVVFTLLWVAARSHDLGSTELVHFPSVTSRREVFADAREVYVVVSCQRRVSHLGSAMLASRAARRFRPDPLWVTPIKDHAPHVPPWAYGTTSHASSAYASMGGCLHGRVPPRAGASSGVCLHGRMSASVGTLEDPIHMPPWDVSGSPGRASVGCTSVGACVSMDAWSL